VSMFITYAPCARRLNSSHAHTTAVAVPCSAYDAGHCAARSRRRRGQTAVTVWVGDRLRHCRVQPGDDRSPYESPPQQPPAKQKHR